MIIRKGEIVVLSDAIIDFYRDFKDEETVRSSQALTFLVIDTDEVKRTADVLSDVGEVVKLGWHDIRAIEKNKN